MDEDVDLPLFINPRLMGDSVGSALAITVVTCTKCGSLVADTEEHEKWHDKSPLLVQFGF